MAGGATTTSVWSGGGRDESQVNGSMEGRGIEMGKDKAREKGESESVSL